MAPGTNPAGKTAFGTRESIRARPGSAGRRPGSGCGNRLARLARAGLLVALAAAGAAQAQTTQVSNLDNTGLSGSSGSPYFGGNTNPRAQTFTTGDHPNGYLLDSVEIKFFQIFSRTQVAASLWSTTTSGANTVPHEKIDDLTPPATIATASSSVVSFTAPSGTMLDASTAYAVVANDTEIAAQVLLTTDDTESLAESGWSIGDTHLNSINGGTNWLSLADPWLIAVKAMAAPASTDATLSGLALADADDNAVSLNEMFSATSTAYTADAANAVETITVTTTTAHASSTVEFLDADDMELDDADGTEDGHQVSLDEGENTIKVKVTAQDGETTETYTLTVTRTVTIVVAYDPAAYEVREDDGYVTLTLRVTEPSTGAPRAFVLGIETSDGTAASPGDYAGVLGQLVSFDVGDTSRAHTINIVNDSHAEPDETFLSTATLESGFDVQIGSATSSTATVTISSSDRSNAEGRPTLSGTPKFGQTLTAATDDITDADGIDRSSFSYAWFRVDPDGVSNRTRIAGATSATYTLTNPDQQKKIVVQARFTDRDGNAEGPLRSAPFPPSGTVTVPANTPATGRPAISGTPQVGQTLTASTSTIADADGDTTASNSATGYTYRWYRVDSDGVGNKTIVASIAAATSTYTLAAADLGKKIVLEVSFDDDADYFEGPLPSHPFPASGTVTSAANTPATGRPEISGTAKVGQTLSAATSSISDADGNVNASTGEAGYAFVYRWFRVFGDAPGDRTEVKTETTGDTSTYTLARADAGQKIVVEASFTDDADNAEGPIASEAYPAGAATVEPLPEVGIAAADGAESIIYRLNLDEDGDGDIDGDATFLLSRTGDTAEALTVPVQLSQTRGFLDSGLLAQEATFQAGNATTTLAVAHHRFRVFSPGEEMGGGTLTATVQNGDGYDVGAAASAEAAVHMIAMVGFEMDSYSFSETDVNPGVKMVARTSAGAPAPPTFTLYLSVSTEGGTGTGAATSPTDYESLSTTLTFPPSAFSLVGDRYVAEMDSGFTLVDDTEPNEGSERLSLKLQMSPGQNPAIGFVDAADAHCGSECRVPVTIVDDDVQGLPTISGTARVGSTLTADTSGLSDPVDGLAGATFSYQWHRVDPDADLFPLAVGTDSASYTLTALDQGKTVTVTVSFDDDSGNPESVTSEPYPAAGKVSGPPCTETAVRLTDGDNRREGEVQICHNNQWRHVCDDHWEKADADVACRQLGYTGASEATKDSTFTNATNLTYWLDDVACTGTESKLSDCAHNGWGTHNCALVAEAAGARCVAGEPAAGSPSITGTPKVGQTLTASAAGITDADGTTHADNGETGYAYAWRWFRVDSDGRRNRTRITGAAASTYTLAAADLGRKIVVEASFTDDANNAEGPLESDPFPSAGTVTTADNNVATGKPEISGTAQVGQTLTAATSSIADADGIDADSFEYQWFRVDSDSSNRTRITDAASSTLTLVDADVGKRIIVEASFTDDEDNAEGPIPSDPYPSTGTVTAAGNNVATGKPTISGTAETGQILTAATSSIMDADGIDADSFEYQWFRVDSDGTSNKTPIAGSTSFAYFLTAEDVGKRIIVEASFTDDEENAEGPIPSDPFPESGTVVQGNSPAEGKPTISGTPQVGQTLTAATSSITDADDIRSDSFTYQWTRVDSDGVGNPTQLTSSTSTVDHYTLVATDVGKKIIVSAYFTDDAGNPEGPLDSDPYPGTGTITATNSPPVFDGGATQTRSLAETVGAATVSTPADIGAAVSATDADADTLAYSLGGADAGKFTLVQTTGQLRTRVGEAYDHEARASYAVTVTVNDGTVDVAAAVTVNITDNTAETPPAPDAPTVAPTPGSTTALDVSWTAPDNTGRPAITHYDLRYQPFASGVPVDGPQDVAGTSAQITGLAGNTDYEVQVRASNADGDGAWSAFTNATTAHPDVPEVTIAAAAPTATYPGDAATFTVTRTGATTGALAVTVELAQDKPFLAAAQLSRTATIPAGSASAELAIASEDLELPHYEPVETGTLTATVAAGSGYRAGAAASASVDIVPFMTVRLEREAYEVSEAAGSVAATVVARTGDGAAAPSAGFSVSFLTRQGTAAEGDDYVFAPYSEAIRPGDFSADGTAWKAEKTVTVSIVDDASEEADETFDLELSGNPGPRILLVRHDLTAPDVSQVATVTIVDDDGDPDARVSFRGDAPYRVDEGGGARIEIHLDPALDRAVTVPLTVAHTGGATAADYSGVPEDVTFPAGRTSRTIELRVADDDEDDDGEGIRIGFGTLPPRIGLGRTQTATVEFGDDDGTSTWHVWLGQAEYAATEGGAPATVTAELSEPWKPWRNEALTVALTDPEHRGGATAGDYSGLPGSVTFPAGATRASFTVTATDDAIDDDGESVAFGIAANLPEDLETGTGPHRTEVALRDNDGARAVSVSFGASHYTAAEGGADATVQVRLDAAPGRSVTVPITRTHNGATGADYSGVPADVTFGANDTAVSFTVTATDDEEDDDLESVRLGFGTLPASVAAGSPSTATVALEDNDAMAEQLEVNFEARPGEPRSLPEGGAGHRVHATLDKAPGVRLSIPLAVTHTGGATAADYSMPSSVTFGARQTRKSFKVDATDDAEPDPGEGFRVDFDPPAGVSVGTHGPYAEFSIVDNDDLPQLSVADASVREWPNPKSHLRFVVTLDRAVEDAVRVDYATADGTAVAGEDYVAASGTLEFEGGDTEKSVWVEVHHDDHDEGTETMTLELSNPDGAGIADGSAEGRIRNTGAMPGSWLARFGRGAADQALDAIGRRLRDAPGGSHLTLGGGGLDRLRSRTRGPSDDAAGDATASARPGAMDAWERMDPFGGGAAGLGAAAGLGGKSGSSAEPGSASGAPAAGGTARRRPGGATGSGLGGLARLLGLPDPRDLLEDSSFVYSPGEDGAGPQWLGSWSAWGETSAQRFRGADGGLRVDGGLATATLGFDTRRDRWLAGLALSHARGDGAYSRAGHGGGDASSSLTSLAPYLRYEPSARTEVWGVIGYGVGGLTLTPSRAGTGIDTDLSHAMAAFGGRTALSARAGDAGRFELALRSDARFTDTASDTVEGLMGAAGATGRVRVLLEGSGTLELAAGGVLKPTLEAGLRYDGGDAETGAGVELGGGLGYARGRLKVRLDGRVLLAHEDAGYGERGFSGSVAYAPGPDGRGLDLRLRSSWGDTQSGVKAMWSRDAPPGLAKRSPVDAGRRLDADIGYGLLGRKGRALWTPYLGAQAAATGSQALRLGLRMASGRDAKAEFELGERVDGGSGTGRGVVLDVSVRF